MKAFFTRNEKRQPEVQCAVLKDLLYQMLSALDFLAACGYIHLDIKPANILWNKQRNGKYHYVLRDFGLANSVSNATTFCGTHMYMAPEIASGDTQSPKSDILSLYATLADILGFIDHRRNGLSSGPRQCQRLIQATRSEDRLLPLAAMADPIPERRPSAAQLLDRYWQGEGRTLRPPTNVAIPKSEDVAMANSVEIVHTKLRDQNMVVPPVLVR
jgi:serine/threonine protein kinase